MLILVVFALGSNWLMQQVPETSDPGRSLAEEQPVAYMYDLYTLILDDNGKPKGKIWAEYMAHYSNSEKTELVLPKMEVLLVGKPPVTISANKSWAMDNNQFVFLQDNVRLMQLGAIGGQSMEMISSEVRLSVAQQYAETDKPVTITGEGINISATGMKAYLREGRLELLSDVYTKILP